MKGIVKANTVDKYLSPVRHQIIELIEPKTTVVEYGCGNGDLLFKLSSKIQSGIGLDVSEQLISYARKRKEKENAINLDFRLADVVKENVAEIATDYSVTSLLFHILSWDQARELLKTQLACSKTVIICGFSKPENWRQGLLLWLDQRFTQHYSNFKMYRNQGFTEGLLNSIENLKYSKYDSFDPVIKIYKMTKHYRT